MSSPLGTEVYRYRLIRDRLLEVWPKLDTETLTDTLEGITDLNEMIAAIIRSALVDEALQAGLRTRLEDMRQRFTRLDERGAKKRQLALDAMCEVGLKKLEQPDFTASARAGTPSLVVMSEGLVPASYWVQQPPKLDRPALLADLKRGTEVPGAQLGNPKPALAVRTK
ncbi:MAG: siphovirus Gp157 family protein [Terriglobales bacterium]